MLFYFNFSYSFYLFFCFFIYFSFFLFLCFFYFFFIFFYLFNLFLFFVFLFYVLFVWFFLLFFFLFYCFLFVFFYIFFFIFFYCFLFLFFLFFPYFRGNSLNSRADLDFKEIRHFSTMIFQKKIMKFIVFFEKSSWKKKKPLGFVEKHIEFQFFYWKIIVEKRRISLNSRSALEFTEIPRK